ncbi:hypothetical protein U5801_07565 [Lamprobacter modestohalophilus]|uniref:hypothetical protein n=1 Tax=Lamprobacter modestohalophilus TaxID=1064514 RepID=UPI002ADEDB33|nr:hypothetical protein [Lamprobacter modestohalophilus]MEA1049664.1 hypothetical protein [Lamprobacter modestohalophilus]
MSAERTAQFPNPDLSPRLVLFPIAGGGVALEWSLDPALIQQARMAFAAHQPVAKLCLRRADGEGARLAEAVFADLSSLSTGRARFEAPVVGPLQAELGFEGQRDSGWLLLARSNRLDAVPEPRGLEPRTADAGVAQVDAQVDASSDALAIAQAAASSVPREPASEAPRRSAGLAPTGALLFDSAVELQSLNRHSVQTSSPSVSAAAEVAHQAETIGLDPASVPALASAPAQAPASALGSAPAQTSALAGALVKGNAEQPLAGFVPAVGVAAALALDPGRLRSVQGWGGLQPATRFPDLSLAACSDRPELRGSPFPLVRVAHATSEVAGDLTSQTADDLASDPVAETNSVQVLLDQEPPNRQDVAPSETRVSRGSGPLSPYPSREGAVIRGELHVFGSAAPGRLLDLGGHPFRVGPGGRFSFRVALDDDDLLAALLARLPRLPVDERES